MSSSLSVNKSSSRRLLKDKLAKLTIVSGGILVLVALLLIFMYLLYVVKPVFSPAEVRFQSSVSVAAPQVLAMGTDERVEMAYSLNAKGEVNFFSLQSEKYPPMQVNLLSEINETSLLPVLSLASSTVSKHAYGYLFSDNRLVFLQSTFENTFIGDQRQLTPTVKYPMGKQIQTLMPEASVLKQIFIESQNNEVLVAGIDGENQVHLNYFSRSSEDGKQKWIQTLHSFDFPATSIQQVLISPSLDRIYLLSEYRLWVYDFRQRQQARLIAQVVLSEGENQVRHAALLAGGLSLIVNTHSNQLSQWFSVPGKYGPEYQQVRQFNTEFEVSGIYPEAYQKGFMVSGEQGQMALYFASDPEPLWQRGVTTPLVKHIALAPHSNGLLLQNQAGIDLYRMSNAHPDVSWSALWDKIWYESYPEEDYVWQSTSASDEYQAKFSLIPLTFGTIKAAMYAMLFSIPLALSAAIYTAYFMSDSMRNWVKPGIEIIEALPTVILGFMAGVWLAPIIENHLPGLVFFSLLMPVAIFMTALGWQKLPQSIRERFHAGWHTIVLIPVLVLVLFVAFSFSETMESWLFDGNVRHYLSQVWSIDYDQRNALVIGIAMGFAVTPTIFSIAEDAIGSVPRHLTDGSLALGATQWQTVLHVVLLTASPGIFAAVMMGLGRAVGETMIVLMATGNTPLTDWNIFQGMRTLAANIAIEMPESEVGSSHYRILFLTAFVLFIFTFIFNTAAEFVRQNLRDKYSRL